MNVQAIRPPYRQAVETERSPRPRAGEVLLATVESQELEGGLRDSVAALRYARPWAHILVRFSPPPDPLLTSLLAPAIGACAVTELRELDRAALGRLLAPSDPAAAIAAWISERSPDLPPDVAGSVRGILERNPFSSEPVRASDLLRRRHRRSGIPSPDAIWRLHRVLPPLLALQRDRSVPQLKAALEAGFADQAALNRASVRLFARTPGSLRRTVGWRWMLWLWWSRAVPNSLRN